MEPIGLYVHFPFCAAKCPYCDFYSAPADASEMDAYSDAVINAVRAWQTKGVRFDTAYFGGGTPSLLGRRLARIAQVLNGEPLREFTVECNPSRVEDGLFEALRASGVDRISMGLQSAVDEERRALGRTADAETVLRRIRQARSAGFESISLDLMLAIPGQTAESLRTSIDFCRDAGVQHVSAYLLKIEENTPFYKMRDTLRLPDEDTVCALYLQAVRELAAAGFAQYEISNFAKDGFAGRHNLKYWNAEEYVGIGPAAHSFVGGKRFFNPRDTAAFLRRNAPLPDGDGGSFEEYAMLRLRLCEGLTQAGTRKRFGHAIPQSLYDRAEHIPQAYLRADADGIRLTAEGFLLSNSITAEILADV
ncbi:MAG: radical SAM family heme chaperone HemW [Clostridia bacterium]|nr:radical SAM family heme chaperone HemW [Clostridia bacterium]